MSKTLLSESEIKKFMKHANLGKDAASNFIGRLNEHSLAEAEEDEPEAPPEEAEGPEGEEALGLDEPPAEGEEPVEEPGAAGEDEAMEAAVETVVSAIVDALGGIPGAPEVSMEAGEEEAGMPGEEEAGMPGEEETDMPGEEEAGMPPGMPPEAGAPEEEEEAALMEYLENANLYMEEELDLEDLGDEGYMEEELYEEEELDEEDLVNEVTRRVAARILQASRRSRKGRKRRR